MYVSHGKDNCVAVISGRDQCRPISTGYQQVGNRDHIFIYPFHSERAWR